MSLTSSFCSFNSGNWINRFWDSRNITWIRNNCRFMIEGACFSLQYYIMITAFQLCHLPPPPVVSTMVTGTVVISPGLEIIIGLWSKLPFQVAMLYYNSSLPNIPLTSINCSFLSGNWTSRFLNSCNITCIRNKCRFMIQVTVSSCNIIL